MTDACALPAIAGATNAVAPNENPNDGVKMPEKSRHLAARVPFPNPNFTRCGVNETPCESKGLRWLDRPIASIGSAAPRGGADRRDGRPIRFLRIRQHLHHIPPRKPC